MTFFIHNKLQFIIICYILDTVLVLPILSRYNYILFDITDLKIEEVNHHVLNVDRSENICELLY